MEPQKIKIWRWSPVAWRGWQGYCTDCGPTSWWRMRTWDEALDFGLTHAREWHGLRI